MAATIDIGTLITRDPKIRGGQPIIAGTGVTVRRIVRWYRMGEDPEQIADHYGHVALAQVHAALAYYHANQRQVDAGIAAEEAEEERLEREWYEQRAKAQP